MQIFSSLFLKPYTSQGILSAQVNSLAPSFLQSIVLVKLYHFQKPFSILTFIYFRIFSSSMPLPADRPMQLPAAFFLMPESSPSMRPGSPSSHPHHFLPEFPGNTPAKTLLPSPGRSDEFFCKAHFPFFTDMPWFYFTKIKPACYLFQDIWAYFSSFIHIPIQR